MPLRVFPLAKKIYTSIHNGIKRVYHRLSAGLVTLVYTLQPVAHAYTLQTTLDKLAGKQLCKVVKFLASRRKLDKINGP